MSKPYREDITPAQTEARRQALVQLLRAAGQAVDAGGSPKSLDRLNSALIGMGAAFRTERFTGNQTDPLVNSRRKREMIFANPDHSPVLRVERYVPTPHKPAWAQEQLQKMHAFEEWYAEEERSTAACLAYWETIAMLEAIARGDTIYMLEDTAAEWSSTKPTSA